MDIDDCVIILGLQYLTMDTPSVIVKLSDNGHPTRHLHTRNLRSILVVQVLVVVILSVGSLVVWSPYSLRIQLEVLPKEISPKYYQRSPRRKRKLKQCVQTMVPKEDSIMIIDLLFTMPLGATN
jgi:hypothetical protein